MSSSEVQRTLVKSPPELWTELGDPVALARHLGGLGDIRITRIEPEQSVEWETEDASGTVLIKPSGWGTKVTLTVTRKNPPAEPTATPAVAATGTDEAPTEVVAEPEHAAEDEPAREADRAPTEAVAEADHAAEDEPALGADHPVQAEPPAEAAPALHAEPEPAVQADTAHAVTIETGGHPDAGAAPTEAHAEDPQTDPELVPRRGFFARLFARRPRKAAVEPEPSEVTVAAVWHPETDDATLAAESQPEPLAPVLTAEAQPGPAEMIPATEQRTDPAVTISAIEQHSDPTMTIGAADVPPEPPEPPVAEETHAEPVAAVAGENAAEELAGPHESPGESPENGSSEPAAVPQTPEEAASAEVTEVLTAVLDRLGAAHHRPFSRG